MPSCRVRGTNEAVDDGGQALSELAKSGLAVWTAHSCVRACAPARAHLEDAGGQGLYKDSCAP